MFLSEIRWVEMAKSLRYILQSRNKTPLQEKRLLLSLKQSIEHQNYLGNKKMFSFPPTKKISDLRFTATIAIYGLV